MPLANREMRLLPLLFLQLVRHIWKGSVQHFTSGTLAVLSFIFFFGQLSNCRIVPFYFSPERPAVLLVQPF